MTISGKACVAGVLGWPVSHSRSPLLHNYWLAEYGIDGAYVPLGVEPSRFEFALRALADLGFSGANVTVPHKEAACRLVDELDPAAKRIGAVNTIVVGAGGRLVGTNTDGFGFVTAIQQVVPRWNPQVGPAVVIGAGGASRAILAALQDAGTPEIRLVNRTSARADSLAIEFGPPVTPVRWDERGDALGDAMLVVNTTSLGMAGNPPLDLPLDFPSRRCGGRRYSLCPPADALACCRRCSWQPSGRRPGNAASSSKTRIRCVVRFASPK